MMTTRCTNCGASKTQDRFYNEPNCIDCATALNEANQYIAAENITDIYIAARAREDALSRRRRGTMGNRSHPSMPVPRIQTADLDRRLADRKARHGIFPR